MLCSGAEARGCSKNEKTAVLQTAAHKRSRFLPVLFLWGEKGRAGLLYCSRRSSAKRNKASAKTQQTAGLSGPKAVFRLAKACCLA